MSRYIDAEWLKDTHYNYATGELVPLAWADIENAPHIDIVRCNECEWLKVHNTKELYAECRKWHIRFYPFDEDTRTHGCSWGERESE